MVAVHPWARHGFCFRIEGLRQSEWLQQSFADLASNAVFRDRFDDHPEKQVVSVAILIALPGRKVWFLLHRPSHERARIEVVRDLIFNCANSGVAKASNRPLRILQSSRT